jgi:hypothetical protein
MTERVITAYELDDGRNFVGRAYFTDMKTGVCKVREGCIIKRENFPKDKTYEQAIIGLYKQSAKEEVLQFRLENVVKSHTIRLLV